MMRANLRLAAALSVLALCIALVPGSAVAQYQPPPPAPAQEPPPPPPPPQQRNSNTFTPNELVREGHNFFGTVSRGLAQVVEAAVSRWGQPNGYILGQEGSGAFAVGLR